MSILSSPPYQSHNINITTNTANHQYLKKKNFTANSSIPSSNGDNALNRAPINKITWTLIMYHLSCTDINRLVTACKLYQEHTGSEWMWEQYDTLIGKLNNYSQQNLLECEINGSNDTTIP